MNLLQFLKPTNLEKEQEKFFSSSTYNPTFTYNWDKNSIEEWLALPSQKKYTSLVEAILSQEPERIVQGAKEVFSTDLDELLLKNAKEIVAQPRRSLTNQSIETLVDLYEEYFALFGFDYRIELSDERGFAVRPSHEEKKITINKNLVMKYNSCEGLVRHELLHIIRSVNGIHNGIARSDNYLPTEEGLACYMQNHGGNEENYSSFQHASRYVATSIALQGSFRDVYEYLCGIGYEEKLAFRRALRHKSGFVDSAQKGDNMKSSMYFYNLQRVQNLSEEEIIRLLVGKIAMEELQQFPSYIGCVDVGKIKDYFSII